MGGDGSLGTTVTMLRKRPTIDQALKQKEIGFVIMPFGTGNDAAQVFGWGNRPRDEHWLDDLSCLARDIATAQNDHLSLWNVEIQTQKTEEAIEK